MVTFMNQGMQRRIRAAAQPTIVATIGEGPRAASRQADRAVHEDIGEAADVILKYLTMIGKRIAKSGIVRVVNRHFAIEGYVLELDPSAGDANPAVHGSVRAQLATDQDQASQVHFRSVP